VSRFSIIIPTLNESEQIVSCLESLQLLRDQGHEVIVSDGGSHDATVSLATSLSDYVVQTKQSRSIQMNAGADKASGDFFLFLHADTLLPSNAIDVFSQLAINEKKWGRFDIKLSGHHFLFRVIETCMNVRSRFTGIATGDQAIYINKELFKEIQGFPEIALMEDIAISKILLKYSKPECNKEKVVSSSRRWEKNGIIKTIFKMWLLRLLYYFQYDVNKLARIYS
jgi:rSAM/selenodomain-associated transferase 2